MLKKYFLLFIILSSNIVYSEDKTVEELKQNFINNIEEYLEKNKMKKEFKEKKYNIKKSQDRVYLKRAIKGYLGAKFINDLDKIPYAYRFILKHTKGEALEEFLNNNDFEKIIENKKDIDNLKIVIDERILFERVTYSYYKLKVKYKLLNLKNNETRLSTIFHVEVTNRNPFDFQVYKEETTVIK